MEIPSMGSGRTFGIIDAAVAACRRLFALKPRTAIRHRLATAIAATCLAAPCLAQTAPVAEHERPSVDLYALMSGNCKTLEVAGHNFACKIVAFFHSEKGRASFTVALDDPADESHVVSFSGEYGQRSQEDLHVLSVERSDGVCRQVGKFAGRQVSTVTCTAADRSGQHYELAFESDGMPITLRRVRPSPPTIRMDPSQ